MVAGSITSVIGLFVMLIVFGYRNEQDITLLEKRAGGGVVRGFRGWNAGVPC